MYQNVPEMVDAVIRYVCPMCRMGEPLDEEGYHPRDQHCYANKLREIIRRYEIDENGFRSDQAHESG